MLSEHERDQAIKEGARNAADAAYFNERPHLADDTGIRVFDAGFDRGWDAATAPLLARIAELEQQLEEARKDAERYRWLRNTPLANNVTLASYFGGSRMQDFDAAIDAARAAIKEQT